MLCDETVLTFSEAAKVLPRLNGKRLHASTIWRWARKGLSGVKLETRRVGARFVTSAEALDRFAKRLAEIELPEHPKADTPRPRSSARRGKALARAESRLAAAGI